MGKWAAVGVGEVEDILWQHHSELEMEGLITTQTEIMTSKEATVVEPSPAEEKGIEAF